MSRPSPRRSLAFRLALLFATLSTLILLGLGLFLRQSVEGHFLEQDEQELRATLVSVRGLLGTMRAAELAEAAHRLSPLIAAVPHQEVVVLDAADRLVFTTEAHAGHAREHAPGGRRGVFARVRLADGAVAKVAITMSVAHHEHFIAGFMRSLAWALGAAVLANALFAVLAARQALKPLEAMARLARRISGERLHERLATESLPLELQPLGGDLNAMLDRLEEAFSRLSGFASDIAHELRTPVTALTTQAQVALARARSPEEYRETLYSSLEECERLSAMIGDMLYLAQAENGLMALRCERVDLGELLEALREFYGILAEEKGVSLVVEGAASATGDASMLRRALGNLISNAIRHTAPGGSIRVRLTSSATGEIVAEVENPGDSIPPQHLEHIFQRFYRVDPARQREDSGGGTGLGLAIARSIATAHGGTLTAASGDGVTRFTLRLLVV